MKKRAQKLLFIKKLLFFIIIIFVVCLGLDNYRRAQAQFLPPINPFGFASPYYYPFTWPMIRTSDIFGRYQSPAWNFIPPFLNLTPPMMSTPLPIVRRPNALTAVTNIKIIFPFIPVTTVVINPYLSPVTATLSSIVIPVTTAQAQPILLAAGVLAPVDTATSALFNLLAPSLVAPGLAAILPASVLSILSLVP